jgi:hypothetical protein
MIQQENGFFALSERPQVTIGQAVGWAMETLFKGL